MTCAMVIIEIHWHKQTFLSLVIYKLPGKFDANIEKQYQIEANIEIYFMLWLKMLVECIFLKVTWHCY